jgi:predicted DNA-binding transcriptional regulator YafY
VIMRASRLISILLLTQARGQVTADQLAAELGVSVRTIYRDVDALLAAGIPLYPAAELGLGAVLAAAQLKVRAALPSGLAAEADRIATRFHLDAPGWYDSPPQAPFLPAVAAAVWRGRVLQVRYRRWKAPTRRGPAAGTLRPGAEGGPVVPDRRTRRRKAAGGRRRAAHVPRGPGPRPGRAG